MAKNTRRYEFTCQTQEQKDKILSILESLTNKTGKPRGEVIYLALQELGEKIR